MQIRPRTSFERDVKSLGNNSPRKELTDTLQTLQSAKNLFDIQKCKKLQGHTAYYRIRIGDFRLGCKLLDTGEVELVRFLPRKDFYKHFPG